MRQNDFDFFMFVFNLGWAIYFGLQGSAWFFFAIPVAVLWLVILQLQLYKEKPEKEKQE